MTDGTVAFGRQYVETVRASLDALDFELLERIVDRLALAHDQGRRVYTLGNGGSAATAAHLVCDLGKNTGGPMSPGLRVACLSDNIPTATALTNDHGYESVFAAQLRTLLDPGDVVIAVSASGNSPNVIAAIQVARARSANVIGLLGFDGGAARVLCDEALVIPLFNYGQVEDIHLIVGHLISQSLRQRLIDGQGERVAGVQI
jgi:D-sedoheptulose 7-phosphate isomerase